MSKHTSSIPYSITRAITTLVTGKYRDSEALKFGRCTISTLQAILSYVSAKNALTPIFPSRDKLAQRTGYTVRSVQRALLELEGAGWIQRLHQQRKRVGTRITNDFSIVPICLTTTACECLSLAYELENIEEIQKKTLLITRSGATKTTYAIKPNQPKAVQIHSAKQKHVENDMPIRIGHYTIPAKLVWLIRTAQFSLPQVFLLMKKFGSKGIKLENFLEEMEMKIGLLNGKSLFSYLLKCSSISDNHPAKKTNFSKAQNLYELVQPLLKKGPIKISTNQGSIEILFLVISDQIWVKETDHESRSRMRKATEKEVRKALLITSRN